MNLLQLLRFSDRKNQQSVGYFVVAKFPSSFSPHNLRTPIVLISVCILYLVSCIFTPVAQAVGINQVINFQGKVTNADGTNVTDGTYDFTIKLYDGAASTSNTLFTENWTASTLWSSTMSSAPSSAGESLTYSSDTHESTLAVGQILWNTTKKEAVKITSVNTGTNVLGISPTRQAWSTSDTVTNKIYVKDGLFTVAINSLNQDLSGVDFNSNSIYLGINFNADGEMKPRIQFTASPYAFNSQKVNGLTVTNTSNNPVATGTILKIADSKTVTFNNGLSFSGTDGSSISFGSGGTVCYSGACTGATVAANSLDFAQFKDAMTLDAGTDIATAGFTLSTSGTGAVQLNNTGGLSTASDFTVAANKSIKLTGGTSFPGSPSEGQLFYRTDNKQLYVYSNSKWQADRTTASEMVAASNSQNKERADYVASGSNDDSTINSAISALPSAGGIVFLMAGTYSIGGPINITKSNVTFIGEGKGTLIQRAWNDTTSAQNTGMITVGDGTNAYDGITITNLQLDGVRTTYNNLNNNGIFFKKKITNSRILNSSIINSYGEGILLYGLSSGDGNTLNTISGNELKNDGGDTAHHAIHIYGPLSTIGNNIISNNIITASSGNGVMIDNSNNNQVTNNVTNSNGNNGIQVYQASYNTITGNNCSSNTSHGIIVNSTSSKNTVSGNTCTLNSGDGILIGGDSNTITGNTVANNSTYGIMISIANYNLISGNVSRDNTAAGINIDQGSASNNVVGNSLYNNTGSGSTYSSLMVNGASSTSANNSLIDNVIVDTAGTAYAIDITGVNATNTTLAGNTYSGTGATSVHDAGTGTLWMNQLNSSNLVFKPSGNIGLGTTSPTAQLHEKGNLATALSGTLGVTNASASVSTSVDQTATLKAGDAITFASQAGTAYTISSLNATTITLTANYTGTTNASTTATRDVTNLFQIDNGAGTTKLTFTKTGQLVLGSPTVNEQLNLDGRIYLADSSAPSTTTNRLYAVSGNLYWNGSQLGAGGITRLDQIAAASNSNTIANGDNAQTWNWALTTSNKTAFTYGIQNANTSAGNSVTGLAIALTGATPSGGTNTITGLNIAATSLASNQFTALNFGSNLTNYISSTANNFSVSSAGALNVATLGSTGTAVIGTGGNTFTFDPSAGPTYAGTARPSKIMVLSPEYPGGVLSADGSSSISGNMISDNELNASSQKWINYYDWESSSASLQDYSILVRVTLPKDFDSWETGSCPGSTCALEFNYKTGTASTADNTFSVKVNSNDDTPGTPICTISAVAATSWTQTGCTSTTLGGSSPAWSSASTNPTAIIRIKLAAKNTASALARAGDITLRYKAKF